MTVNKKKNKKKKKTNPKNKTERVKERTCQIVDFAVPTDYRVKLKERKENQIPRPYSRTKKLWNMKVTMIHVVISVLRTIPSGLVKGLKDFKIIVQAETILTTTFLRLARILRRVLKTRDDLLSLKLQ